MGRGDIDANCLLCGTNVGKYIYHRATSQNCVNGSDAGRIDGDDYVFF